MSTAVELANVLELGVGEPDLVNLASLAIGGFVSFSLLIWDFICHLPDELKLIKDARKINWRLPDPLAFILVRYSALGFAVVTLFNLTLKIDSCQLVVSLSQVFSLGVVVANGVLIAKRTITLWNNDTAVVSLLSTFFVVMIGSWIATASQHRSTTLQPPLPEFGTNCSVAELPPWNPVNYASSALFFSIIFVLAMHRLATQRTERVLNLGLTPINRACLWYLMVNASTAMALFIVTVPWHSQWTTAAAKRIAAPFFILLLAAMSQRMYLNNQADYTLRRRRLQGVNGSSAKSQEPSGARWSYLPRYKTEAPVVPMVVSYPRPPVPPPSVPFSQPQHEDHAAASKSRTTSISESSSSDSTTKSPDLGMSSTAGEENLSEVQLATSPTSTLESAFSIAIRSPVSSIGFSSPPGSPPVLSLPWPGKDRVGKNPQYRRQTGSSFASSFEASQPGTPVRMLDRLPSFKSGWLR